MLCAPQRTIGKYLCLCCPVLQYVAEYFRVLQYVAVCGSVICVTICWSEWQCVAAFDMLCAPQLREAVLESMKEDLGIFLEGGIHINKHSMRRILRGFPIFKSLLHMGWRRIVGSIKLYVSFAKEPYKRDIFCKRDLYFN